MPIVYVHMFKGRTLDQKKKMVKGITKVMMDVLNVDQTQVRVAFEEFSPDNWAIAGEFPLVKAKKSKKRK